MSIDSLKGSIPEYAKDLKLNLSSISRSTVLSEQQLWGTLLATAAATKSAATLKEIAEEAADNLSAEAYNAALGAASIMGMNNVFYRTKGYLDGKYDDLRAGLRMNIIANSGIAKADFELFSLAVSAVNGCNHCLEAHEKTLRDEGVDREGIFEAIRAASIVAGVGQAADAEADIKPGEHAKPHNRFKLAAVVAKLVRMMDRHADAARLGAARLGFRDRWAVLAAARIYTAIGRKVLDRGQLAWNKRVVVSGPEKLWHIIAAWWEALRNNPHEPDQMPIYSRELIRPLKGW